MTNVVEQVATIEKPLAGKVAIVTGASRGIGAAIAKVLADKGFKKVYNVLPGMSEWNGELEKEIK